MKEKMMSLKAEEEAKVEKKEVDLDTLSAEDKLLEERFGKKNKEWKSTNYICNSLINA